MSSRKRAAIISMVEQKKETDSSFVRVLIEQDDPRAVAITRGEAKEIEQYILDQSYPNLRKQPRPCFNGVFVYSDEGALIVSPHVDTLSWLREVIKSYPKKVLRITDLKDSPQYTAKVQAGVPYLNRLVEFLELQNIGLQTDAWRIISYGTEEFYYNDYKGRRLTLLIDDPGRILLEKNDFKLFLGMSTITFKLIERVRRCEITGKIVSDEPKLAEDILETD